MITANFRAYGSYVTDSLYQWDLDQILAVEGLNLTTAPEIHFSNANVDRAIVAQTTMDGHVVRCKIPNSLLQDPLRIRAHVGIYEEETFKIIEQVEIPVLPRKRPADYQLQATDGELYSFKALENKLANRATAQDLAAMGARLDAIVANANETEGNSELVDLRVGADGKTYTSAGAAVRSQLTDLAQGQAHAVEYTIEVSSTPALNLAIKERGRYQIVLNYGANVDSVDVGYTRADGTDVQLIDNAVSGQAYEVTTEEAGTRFRFWTYLAEDTATTVEGTVTELGTLPRLAQTESGLGAVEASLTGFKGRVSKAGVTVATGYTLEAVYKPTAGRAFYVIFDTFPTNVLDRVNIYTNTATYGNEMQHDGVTPVLGHMYRCYTDRPDSTLHLYMVPKGAGGDVDFTVTILEEDAPGAVLNQHTAALSVLQASEAQTAEGLRDLYTEVGLPTYDPYELTVTTTDARDLDYPMEDGKEYALTVAAYSGRYLKEVQVYLFNSMSDYKAVPNVVHVGGTVIFEGDSAYKYVRVYVVTTQTEPLPATLLVQLGEYKTDAILRRLSALETVTTPPAPRVLVLGDSYSQMGYWIQQLGKLVQLGEVVNLGVSSASLKDKYTDREAYPYDSRPVSNDTRGGNVNTLGSQVEKLKRLMAGADLDDGEQQVYNGSAPDIILIEGGTNDPPDASTDDYVQQIYTVASGYVARRSDTAPKQGYIKLPVAYEDTDRTTFAGALRYLYGALHDLFPQALIFAITPCGLTYMSGGEHPYLLKGEQIKQAAALLGLPVIDWGANGRLTVCDNVVTGSGTEADPYIYDAPGEYSADALHPNQAGARFLAMEVAKVLTAYNLAGYLK